MHGSTDGEPCQVEIFRRRHDPVIADGGDDQEPSPEQVETLLTKQGALSGLNSLQRTAGTNRHPPGRRNENARYARTRR
jgi:hypothetical protein